MAPNRLSLLQKLDIGLGIIQALIETVIAATVAPFRGPNTPKQLKRHLLLTLCREVLDRLSTQQLQSIAGSSESNYLAWTKAQNLKPQIIDLPSIGTKAFWIGSPDAKNTVIYYHGGGWAMPCGDGHLTFMASIVSSANKAGKSVAVLALQYDLAPGRRCPRQLTQAIELLRYATTELERSPQQIILAGDSSGANLILGVLSHLMHPHPSIKPLKLSKPFKSAMLSSPVTVLNVKNERFRTHETQDPASAETIRVWMNNFLGSNKPDAWNQPLDNDIKWWSGLIEVVDDMLITVASNEMMAEETSTTAATIKSAFSGLTLFSSEADFHAQPAIGPSLGMGLGEAAALMASWTVERF